MNSLLQNANNFSCSSSKTISLGFSSETHQRLNVERDFIEWLVGFTDGDGCFSITKSNINNSYQFSFKIGQSVYNGRILHYIKKNLGYGSITKSGVKNTMSRTGIKGTSIMLQYRICDTKVLKYLVMPIFLQYPLHTMKYYNFNLFKQALYSADLETRTNIKQLFKEGTPDDYLSPHSNIPTKNWIVGFTEAEGSFYIVKKESGRLVHGFGFTQKRDKRILEQLRTVFNIKSSVKSIVKGGWGLDTTNSRSIESIIVYYKDTLKGMKSVEYRIWARSYFKHKGDFEALTKIQQQMRKLRTKQPPI
uniref:intron-encoded endonuclease family protein n=1 Tax=Limnomonas spitsbergensis TaxID=2954232 RepID=UPI002551F6E1|nr:intron-encoded endonuclease family protein [Limnomonas spitsbergensis]WEV87799.1 intron-encoded endonuclease family protein [Limnomonas spitsbergensis]